MDDKQLLDKMVSELEANGCNVVNNIPHSTFSDSDIEIILKYMGKFEESNYNGIIISCLHRSKKRHLSSILLDEYISTDIKGVYDYYRWSIGDALYAINDKSNLKRYMDIISDKSYGVSRQMIVMLVGKIKDTSSIDLLLKLVWSYDYDVLPHAIWALGRYKTKETADEIYRFMLELTSDEGQRRFIRDVEYLVENNRDYRSVDIRGFWSNIQKEANKTLSKYDCAIKTKLNYKAR